MLKWIKVHKFMTCIILGLIIMFIIQGVLIAQFVSVLQQF